MSSSTPRKFSEKIAIMERKQNEDVNQFEDIMREVRSITNTNDPPGGVPIPGQLQPPTWPHPHLGGSLPNVAQLHNYGPPNWQQWEHQRAQRSRSPEAHFHPYRATGRSQERVPPLHPHYAPYPPQHTLQPPDSWHQINRARSDPNIHNIHQSAPMHPMYPMVPHNQLMHQMQPGPSGMHSGAMPMHPMGPGPLQPGSLPPQMAHQMQSPMQSPVHHMMPGAFPFTNGSPMQSPMGSPMGSTIMLEERTTPIMELSPPGMMQEPDQVNSMSNLPNLPQIPPNCYHATVGQRHSTGCQCVRLVPGPPLTPSESQSAPTSPANVTDALTQPQWPTSRTFSNSPESKDIPRVVLTNPDGGHGQHFDCYNDLQHLTLDSNEMASLCNGSGLPEHQIL